VAWCDLVLITVTIVLLLTPSWGQVSNKSTVPAYSEAFEGVWRDIDQDFYDPSFLGVNWAATGERYRVRLADIHTNDDFKELIDQMLRELPTSHLHFRVPVASKTMTPATEIGVLTRHIDGESVVVGVSQPLTRLSTVFDRETSF
jgi:hypothetical protein